MNRAERRKYAKRINTPQKLENFSSRMSNELRKEYEQIYKKELENAIDIFILTIVYTLHYNESTKFGNKRIKDFMEDLLITVDMFRTGEYNPDEYREALLKDGIEIINRKGEI